MQEKRLTKWRLIVAAEAVLCLAAFIGSFCVKLSEQEMRKHCDYRQCNDCSFKEYYKQVFQ